MNIINKKYFRLILFLAPLLFGLQTFLPTYLETPFIYFKLIILPLILLYLLRTKKNIVWFYLIFLYLFLLSIFYSTTNFKVFTIYVLSIFSSIPLYLFGKFLINSKYDLSNFKYLIFGVNMFNVITLLIMLLLSFGYLDMSLFFEQISRTDEAYLNIFRFALGNAIEVPFIMSSFLFAGIILSQKDNKSETFPISAFLNLILSIVSQSRIVIIIALILFIYQLHKSSWKIKTLIIAFVLLMVYYLSSYFDEVLLSSLDRMKGNDSGSSDERIIILNYILKYFWENNFLFGNGLTSVSELLRVVHGSFRTAESLFLEILYDTGFFGIFLILGPILKNNLNHLIKGDYRLALIFTYIQMMFFLPVFPSMMFVFFVFGTCANNKIYNSN